MGKGIDLGAMAGSPEHAAMIDDMKDQLLIVLVKRLGGDIQIPCSEVDDTSGQNLAMKLDPETRVFTFTVVRVGAS